jgi:hypothetical protein
MISKMHAGTSSNDAISMKRAICESSSLLNRTFWKTRDRACGQSRRSDRRERTRSRAQGARCRRSRTKTREAGQRGRETIRRPVNGRR